MRALHIAITLSALAAITAPAQQSTPQPKPPTSNAPPSPPAFTPKVPDSSAISRGATHPSPQHQFDAPLSPTIDAKYAKPIKLSPAERLRRQPDYLRHELLDGMFQDAPKRSTSGFPIHRSPDLQTSYLAVRRTVTSEVELHARWDDFVIVRSGTGTVLLGEQMIGGRTYLKGERRKGTIVNPTRYALNAGLILRIPAGVPHQFFVEGGVPLDYVLIKVRKPHLPLD